MTPGPYCQCCFASCLDTCLSGLFTVVYTVPCHLPHACARQTRSMACCCKEYLKMLLARMSFGALAQNHWPDLGAPLDKPPRLTCGLMPREDTTLCHLSEFLHHGCTGKPFSTAQRPFSLRISAVRHGSVGAEYYVRIKTQMYILLHIYIYVSVYLYIYIHRYIYTYIYICV